MTADVTIAAAAPPGTAADRAQPVAVAIIGLLFFVFGFATWLNGSLIPFLKIVCDLNNVEAFLVTFAFYIAYTVMALPMSAVLARTGYRAGMGLGLGIMAVGALIHIPAAFAASFPLFLVGLFTLGTGLTVLQTASNPYIVLIGPAESAAKRISIMGIVNKAAGVIVPLVFASLVLARVGDVEVYANVAPSPEVKQLLAERLVLPYLAMAAVLLLLVAFVRFAPLPDVTPEPVAEHDRGVRLTSRPNLVFGVLTLFAYMGMEVIAGDTIGLFGQHLGVPNFLSLTSYTMSFMVLGYILGVALIPRVVSQRAALIGCGVAGLAATGGVLLSSPTSSAISSALWGWSGLATLPDPVFFVATMGLAHALVWPTVWPFALRGLGEATSRASALLIMAISGGALIPLVFGWLSNVGGDMQRAYVIALPCYLIILAYGLFACTLTSWSPRRPTVRAG